MPLSVRDELGRRGVNDTIGKWIAQTSMDDEAVFVKATRGKPQDGVTSPLSCLVVDELLQRLTELYFECVGCADEIVLKIRGNFEGTLCYLLQRGLRIFEK